MAAIDQPAAEAAFAFDVLVEVDARSILIEAGRDHVLRLFDGDAVDMIDALADLIVAVEVRAAGQAPYRKPTTSIGGQASLKTLGSSTVGRRGT